MGHVLHQCFNVIDTNGYVLCLELYALPIMLPLLNKIRMIWGIDFDAKSHQQYIPVVYRIEYQW